jgi:outer membrane protein
MKDSNGMTKTGILVGAMLAATLSLGGGLAAAQEVKVGVVSFSRLLDEAPQAQASQRALQEEFAPRQRDLRGREERLKGLEERLQQGEGFMSEDERRELERDFRDQKRDFDRAKTEFAEDLSLRRNEELGGLQRMLIGEVQTYSQAQNYDLIISDAGGIVYASDAVDITQQILDALVARGQSGTGSD